jgi:hypothetical protein
LAPLHGRLGRLQSSEYRFMGRFVHVEVAPGVITIVAAWMLDPVACAGMEIGAPRARVTALIDLHQLLIERGFRGSSLGDSRIVQEEQNEEFAKIGSANTGGAHTLAPAQHCVRFHPEARQIARKRSRTWPIS